MARWSCYAFALVCTVAAFFCAWTHYGGIELGLTRFPGWQAYLVGVVLLHVGTIWDARVLSIAGAATALVTAAVFMVNHSNSSWLFEDEVPMVVPRIGFGGVVAMAGVALNVALLLRVGPQRHAGATGRPR